MPGQLELALAPGAWWVTKAWPEVHWVDLVARLRREGLGWSVVGGTEDRTSGTRILAGGPGTNLAGETSVLETAAVLERCRVLVTNDSALLHLAPAVGARVVALSGPTVTGFYPFGPDDVVFEAEEASRPCSLHGDDGCPKGHHRCLEALGAEDVIDALLSATGGVR